jgi:DNA-binding NarL/FixJ family response regulator
VESTVRRPAPLLVLPCIDAAARFDSYAAIEGRAGIHLLPMAAASNLAKRADDDRPDVILIATEDFASRAWRQSDSIKDALFAIPSLLLAGSMTPALKRRAARFHIRSVLPLDLNTEQLLAALPAVASGLTVTLEPPATEDNESEWRAEEMADDPLVEHLTTRETMVLRLMALGHGNKVIASRLAISEHTAKFHVASILAKLGAASRTEAVTIGILRGLVAI